MNLLQRAVRKVVRETTRAFGLDQDYITGIKQENYRVKVLAALEIDLVADVGANVGQYASGLLKKGFKGNILSFEPVSDVYEKLSNRNKLNPKWAIYERCAVGGTNGEVEINVSKNYESSSIQNVLEKSIIAEPLTGFVKKEKIKLVKLSDVAELQQYNKIHLKIDVQGYEESVLDGAMGIFDRVSSIELEISLVPLYEGALLPEVLLSKLKKMGFTPIFFASAFNNNNTGAIMQLDGFFVKDEYVGIVNHI